jgi:hypothetical protein
MQSCAAFEEPSAKVMEIYPRGCTAGDGQVAYHAERIPQGKKCYLEMWRACPAFISLSAFQAVMFYHPGVNNSTFKFFETSLQHTVL